MLSEPCSCWPVAASMGSGHYLAIIMPRYDVTAGHYYSQLMTTAHTSCHGQVAAWFTEHGQHVGHHSMLENHGQCPANDNLKVGLNMVSSR